MAIDYKKAYQALYKEYRSLLKAREEKASVKALLQWLNQGEKRKEPIFAFISVCIESKHEI